MSQRKTSKPVGTEVGGVSSMGIADRVGGMGDNRGGMGNMVVVPDNGSSLDFLDDGFTGNGVGVRYGNGFGHMVRSGHFYDFLNMYWDIIGNIVWFLNMYGLVDGVDFFLNFDDGCGE